MTKERKLKEIISSLEELAYAVSTIKRKPKLIRNYNLKCTEMMYVAEIINQVPDVLDYINDYILKRFTGAEWFILLTGDNNEILEKICIWENVKYTSYKSHNRLRRKIDYIHWARLISEKPKYRFKIDMNLFSIDNWVAMLIENRNYANEFDFNKLNSSQWARLLFNNNSYMKEYNQIGKKILSGIQWKRLVFTDDNNFFHKYCDWDSFNSTEITELLFFMPEYHVNFDLNKLIKDDRKWLVSNHPHLEKFIKI